MGSVREYLGTHEENCGRIIAMLLLGYELTPKHAVGHAMTFCRNHPGVPVYAKRLCKNCYINAYNRRKRSEGLTD
jgi:hypothetical protein